MTGIRSSSSECEKRTFEVESIEEWGFERDLVEGQLLLIVIEMFL